MYRSIQVNVDLQSLRKKEFEKTKKTYFPWLDVTNKIFGQSSISISTSLVSALAEELDKVLEDINARESKIISISPIHEAIGLMNINFSSGVGAGITTGYLIVVKD